MPFDEKNDKKLFITMLKGIAKYCKNNNCDECKIHKWFEYETKKCDFREFAHLFLETDCSAESCDVCQYEVYCI